MTAGETMNKGIYYTLAVLYIAVITITFYSDTMIPKIASMMIIPPVIMLFLIRADFERTKTLIQYPLLLLFGIFLTFLLSGAIWILNVEQTMYILEGSQRVLFQGINVVVVFCAVYLFGSKAVDYTLYSACLMNSIRMILALLQFGPSQSLKDFMLVVKTGEQVGFMRAMEIQAITYLFALFVIYYLFVSDYSKKKKALYIGACAFFIVLGFKRIIFASMFASIGLGFLGLWLPDRLKGKYLKITAICLAVFSLLYIYWIRSGAFEFAMNALNIATNNRIEIYNQMRDTYQFSPMFLGRGVDFVVRYLEYLKTLNLKFGGSSVLFIHNDILVRFIEMGFWGFCGWLYTVCIFSQNWILKKYGIKCAYLYCIANVYSFINYSVGNSNRAYAVRMVLILIIIASISFYQLESKKEDSC